MHAITSHCEAISSPAQPAENGSQWALYCEDFVPQSTEPVADPCEGER